MHFAAWSLLMRQESLLKLVYNFSKGLFSNVWVLFLFLFSVSRWKIRGTVAPDLLVTLTSWDPDQKAAGPPECMWSACDGLDRLVAFRRRWYQRWQGARTKGPRKRNRFQTGSFTVSQWVFLLTLVNSFFTPEWKRHITIIKMFWIYRSLRFF